MRATGCLACRRSSRSGRTKYVPGPCIAAALHSTPPARSIPTSNVDSSAPRRCPIAISSARGRTRRRASKAWSEARGGTTWCRTGTSCCSGSTSSGALFAAFRLRRAPVHLVAPLLPRRHTGLRVRAREGNLLLHHVSADPDDPVTSHDRIHGIVLAAERARVGARHQRAREEIPAPLGVWVAVDHAH